jgi:hypothetical protein
MGECHWKERSVLGDALYEPATLNSESHLSETREESMMAELDRSRARDKVGGQLTAMSLWQAPATKYFMIVEWKYKLRYLLDAM